MSDDDKTRKLPVIRRRLTVEELIRRDEEQLRRWELEVQTIRERLDQRLRVA